MQLTIRVVRVKTSKKAAKALLEVLERAELSSGKKEELGEAANFAIEQAKADKPKRIGLAMYAERVKEIAELTKDTGDISTRLIGFYTVAEQFIGKLPV